MHCSSLCLISRGAVSMFNQTFAELRKYKKTCSFPSIFRMLISKLCISIATLPRYFFYNLNFILYQNKKQLPTFVTVLILKQLTYNLQSSSYKTLQSNYNLLLTKLYITIKLQLSTYKTLQYLQYFPLFYFLNNISHFCDA